MVAKSAHEVGRSVALESRPLGPMLGRPTHLAVEMALAPRRSVVLPWSGVPTHLAVEMADQEASSALGLVEPDQGERVQLVASNRPTGCLGSPISPLQPVYQLHVVLHMSLLGLVRRAGRRREQQVASPPGVPSRVAPPQAVANS